MTMRDRAGNALEIVVTGIEWIVAASLVVLAGMAAWVIILEFFEMGLTTREFADYTKVLDGTLFVFVVAELFKIAFAYIRHENVVPTVMEAALVAVARKVVVLDTHVTGMELLLRSGSLAVLLLSIGVAWLLLNRANPCIGKIPTDHE